MKFWLTDGIFHREERDRDRGYHQSAYPDTGVPYDIPDNAEEIIIPEGTVTLGQDAFRDMKMHRVILPESVKKIDKECFKYCNRLADVVLPDQLEKIGDSAFSHTALRRIRIPESVKRISAYCFSECKQLEEVVLPSKLKEIDSGAFSGTAIHRIRIPDSIKKISGFEGCSQLDELVLPEGLEEIGYCAFAHSALRSIRIPPKVRVLDSSCFHGCEQLEDVVLPEGLKKIGFYAFAQTALRSIRIPDSVKQIDRGSFFRCTRLEELALPDGLEEIYGDFSSDGAFSGTALRSIRIPPKIKKLGADCFSGCELLQEVILPEGLKEIGEYCFSGCKQLREVALPERLEKIGFAAFSDTPLHSIRIPSSVKRIGFACFSDCRQLKEVALPEGLEEIEGQCFENCVRLKQITFPQSLKVIGVNAFEGCSGLKRLPLPPSVHEPVSLYGCTSLEEYTIPEGASMLPENAFRGWSKLKELDLPDTITVIDSHAFMDCTSLERIHLPEALTKIDRDAFSGCTALEEIRIPDKVRVIREDAFHGCTSLRDVVLPANLEQLGNWFTGRSVRDTVDRGGVFENCSSLEHIRIPDGLGWIGFSSFRGCGNLREVTFPKGTVSICEMAFMDCTSLEELDLPPTLQCILARAFYGCKRLRKLVARGGILDFARSAFQKCPALREVWIPREQVKEARLLFSTKVKLFDLHGNSLEADVCREFDPSEAKSEQDREVLDTIAKVIPLRKLLTWMIKKKYPRKLLESVQYANSGDRAPVEAVTFILYAYISQAPGMHPHNSATEVFVSAFSPEADAVAAKLDHAQLMDVLTHLCCPGDGKNGEKQKRISPKQAIQMDSVGYRAYANFETPQYLYPYCRYADTEEISALIQLTRKQSAAYYKAAFYYRSALMLSDAKEAMDYADRIHHLDLYASMRGKTQAQMEQETYLAATKERGLRPDGSMRFDLGSDEVLVEARLNDDLQFVLCDGNEGKVLRSFPKKGIDPQKRADADAAYKAMKKTLQQMVKKHVPLLQQQYNAGAAMERGDWEERYLRDPLLGRIAALLVWQQGKGKEKAYFTLREGQMICADGTPYALREEGILLAHPVEMCEEEVAQWQRYFTDRQLRQPFAQVLWEPVIHWKSRNFSTYYKGVELCYDERKVLKAALKQRGIELSMEYEKVHLDGYVYQQYFNEEGGMSLGNALHIDTVVDPDSRSITLGKARVDREASPREINSVLIELDKLTLSAQVANDNVDALTDEALRDFTAAQLAEFIDLSIKKEATSCTARLLDYKNSRFPQYSDLEQFTLDW